MKPNNLIIKVVPRAKQVRVEVMLQGLKVWLTAAPEGGAANRQLVEVLSEYLGVPKRVIMIKSGHTSRIKIVEISK